MENQKADQIIQYLNALLDPGLSLHSISYIFHNIAEILTRENIKVKIVKSKQFYLDPELHFIYLKKRAALENHEFDTAAKYRQREKELILEKGQTEMAILRTDPEISFFEYYKNSFIGYLSMERVKDRLIIHLLEGYDLGKKK